MSTVRCDSCGGEYGLGEWPWCPHGTAGTNWADAPIEPYFDEHISTEGEWITSRGQRRALMAKNGLDYKHKKQPRPGSTIFFDMGRR